MTLSATETPSNLNTINPIGFKFQILKLPHLSFWCKTAAIPGLSLGEISHPSPFTTGSQVGDSLTFEELNITFEVDEDLTNWKEIAGWMVQIGFPRNYNEFKGLKTATLIKSAIECSDATLTSLNNTKIPNFQVRFRDCFPMSLSPIEFDTTQQDVPTIDATLTIKYLNYDILTII